MPITTLDDFLCYRYGLTHLERSTFKLRYFNPSLGAVIFLINLIIMFPCKHCPERFTALSARGLTQHHRKCQAFLKHEAEANQRRKATVASNKARRTKLRVKVEDRKASLGSASTGVSIFDNQ